MWFKAIFLIFVFSTVEGCIYKKLECAPYTVIVVHPNYEVRSYSELTWVTTTAQDRLSRIATHKAFMRLFHYISGRNDRSLTINMTVPVRMKKTQSAEKLTIEMSFMVPSEIAQNPPNPNDDRITISYEPPTLYAVRQFSGYVWREATWQQEARILADSLADDDTVDKSLYYQVGYDAPYNFLNRRNEVWMVKKTEEQSNMIENI